MSRTTWLAALIVLVAPGRGPGQDLADEPPQAVGLRMVGAFQGGAFQGGQDNQGHKVRIEMEGGQTLEGYIDSQPFIVDGDLGRYTIWPTKIRTIQFLKRSNVEVEDEDEPEPKPHPQPNPRNPRAMGMMGQMGGGMMAQMGGGMMGGGMMMQQPTLIRGKLTTTTGKVIVGDIHVRPNFSLTLDFGFLAVAPEKLRTLTMIEAEADPSGVPSTPPNAGPKPTTGPQQPPSPPGQGNTRSGRQKGSKPGSTS